MAKHGNQRDYSEFNSRVHQLQGAMDIMLEYLRYKQISDSEATTKTLGIYPFQCYIQGQLHVMNLSKNKSGLVIDDMMKDKPLLWEDEEEE